MSRSDVSFDSGGERCAAWLYRAGPGCVVLAHGFGAVRAARLDAYAERFAAAGLTALVFDYRHFGESGGEPRQLLDIRRQLDDWRAALAFARTLDGVDPAAVAAWGTSFSGGHVATIAAEDRRLAAAVSQAPFMDGVWALRAAGARAALRMAAAGLRDELARLRGRAPHTFPIVAEPGRVAAMSQPDAEPGYRALYPPDAPLRNEVAARIALRTGFYRPVRLAARIACPWLVCVCERDDVTPPQPALRAAARAPRAQLRTYDCGHFDVYRGDHFERAVADQVDFLTRTLSSAPAGRPAPSGGASSR